MSHPISKYKTIQAVADKFVRVKLGPGNTATQEFVEILKSIKAPHYSECYMTAHMNSRKQILLPDEVKSCFFKCNDTLRKHIQRHIKNQATKPKEFHSYKDMKDFGYPKLMLGKEA